jgi:hypothetical protein
MPVFIKGRHAYYLYYSIIMSKENLNNKLLGAFIVPTGIGASIGGYAGDASVWARKFAQKSSLIVNPNVVNAGCFSGITENMLYVEGYSLDEFFKGNLGLMPSINNKVGVIFDKGISQDVLNIHINTINAVKTVYGIDIVGYEITDEAAGVEFSVQESNISAGKVSNIKTLYSSTQKLIEKGANAIAIVCKFEDDTDEEDEAYSSGAGVDPVGGVEAIISHYISREFKLPAAHSPAFEDYTIYPKIVNPKASAEYITPTFLPCILIGLSMAPKLTSNVEDAVNIDDLDYLVMPYNSLGSVPVIEAVKRGIKVYAVKENESLLGVTAEKLAIENKVCIVDTYEKCFNEICCCAL